MYHYTVFQWLFFFYFYCLFGWCFESAYVSAKKRKFVNRGFMRGPFLPLYGSGAIMMLVVSKPVSDHIVLVYIAGCLGATMLEYVTGVLMESLFQVRYWDYSNQKFNFQGHICLGSTLAWGFLTILMTEIVHKPVEMLVRSIPLTAFNIITVLITAVLLFDFMFSFRAAMELRGILINSAKVKDELLRMQKRLDVMLAFADSDREERKQDQEYRIEELFNSIEEKFAGMKHSIQEKPADYMESIKEELSELRSRFGSLKDYTVIRDAVKNFYRRHLLLDNPGMYSLKFKEALEVLKQAAEDHRRNK